MGNTRRNGKKTEEKQNSSLYPTSNRSHHSKCSNDNTRKYLISFPWVTRTGPLSPNIKLYFLSAMNKDRSLRFIITSKVYIESPHNNIPSKTF